MIFSVLLKYVTKSLYMFDAWGEPVPQINMGGQSVYRTRLGGCVGLAVSIIIATFTISRLIKMVNKDDPHVF